MLDVLGLVAAMSRAQMDKVVDELPRLPTMTATNLNVDTTIDAYPHTRCHIDGNPAGKVDIVPIATGAGWAPGQRITIVYTEPAGAWAHGPSLAGGVGAAAMSDDKGTLVTVPEDANGFADFGPLTVPSAGADGSLAVCTGKLWTFQGLGSNDGINYASATFFDGNPAGGGTPIGADALVHDSNNGTTTVLFGTRAPAPAEVWVRVLGIQTFTVSRVEFAVIVVQGEQIVPSVSTGIE